jgi:DHA1 family bicyclomycin/chloramphenicol resistance-like MFS transporter
VVAPVVGGQLARIMDWRGIFGVLAGIGVALLLVVLLALPETLEPSDRHAGGVRSSARTPARSCGIACSSRCCARGPAAGGVLHLSMTSFVLQDEFGLDPQGSASPSRSARSRTSRAARQPADRAPHRPLRVYLLGVTATAIATVVLATLALLGAGVWGFAAALVGFMLCAGLGGPTRRPSRSRITEPGAGTPPPCSACRRSWSAAAVTARRRHRRCECGDDGRHDGCRTRGGADRVVRRAPGGGLTPGDSAERGDRRGEIPPDAASAGAATSAEARP